MARRCASLIQITIEYFHKGKNSPQETAKGSIVDLLTALVQSRYDTNSKFLNLENLIEDPNFIATKIKGFQKNVIGSKFGAALCKLVEELCPEIKTISLANNKIENLTFFSTLAGRVPDLENISFKDNLIRTFEDLQPFNGRNFKSLRELILDGNPIREKELSKAGGHINFMRYCEFKVAM